MKHLGRYTVKTGPAGLWCRGDMLGAVARIVASDICSAVWNDTEEYHVIQDIRYRVDNKTGNMMTEITLSDLPNQTFGWSNLEVISLCECGK